MNKEQLMKIPGEAKILAADIGGTKALLRLSQVQHGGETRILCQRRYTSARFATFDELLAQFLADCSVRNIDAACLAVAGPVSQEAERQTARVTNLPWRLDSRELAAGFLIRRIRLINDFAAVAYGIDTLKGEELRTLQSGKPAPDAPRLVAGAGTGFGVALVIRTEVGEQVLSTEAGHADFAPSSLQLEEISAYLRQNQGRCAVEDMLSGRGLVNIHDFLCRQEGAVALDDAAAVSEAAADGDVIAGKTVDLFCHAYGAAVGNLALFCLPRGGIYIAGGIAPKLIGFLEKGGFLAAFRDKGKMSALMEEFPLAVVMNPEVGLQGAEEFAKRNL